MEYGREESDTSGTWPAVFYTRIVPKMKLINQLKMQSFWSNVIMSSQIKYSKRNENGDVLLTDEF